MPRSVSLVYVSQSGGTELRCQPIRVMSSRSVYLTTLSLGFNLLSGSTETVCTLSPETDKCPSQISKKENDPRKYFMGK